MHESGRRRQQAENNAIVAAAGELWRRQDFYGTHQRGTDGARRRSDAPRRLGEGGPCAEAQLDTTSRGMTHPLGGAVNRHASANRCATRRSCRHRDGACRLA